MRNSFYVLLAALLLGWLGPAALAAEQTNDLSELDLMVNKVRAKMQEGKKSEADYADDLKQFDALLAKKANELAQVLLLKARLYDEVLKQQTNADILYQQIVRMFPGTVPAQIVAQEQVQKANETYKVGTKFPDFAVQDVDGKPLSTASYKGKVVLVEFWATWCPPCRAELPNIIKTYEKYHAQGFEVIGISLDQSKEQLKTFTAEQKMPWPQYFDGAGWGNALVAKYGIRSIPATFLLDGQGTVIAKDLRGEQLDQAVSQALVKK